MFFIADYESGYTNRCVRCRVCDNIGHNYFSCALVTDAKNPHPSSVIDNLDLQTFMTAVCYLAGDVADIRWGDSNVIKWQKYEKLLDYVGDDAESLIAKFPDNLICKITFDTCFIGKCYCMGMVGMDECEKDDDSIEIIEEIFYVSIPTKYSNENLSAIQIEEIHHILCGCNKIRLWVVSDICIYP